MNEQSNDKEETGNNSKSPAPLGQVKRLVMCFIVLDCADYEGCNPIAVFRERGLAEKFVTTCKEYDTIKPPCPEGDDVAEWEAYQVKYNSWDKDHPGGETCTCVDNYSISDRPYFT